MKIMIVRHGDPNYELDTLTETGWREANALAPRIMKIDESCGGFKGIYLSPLGRAQDTAKPYLEMSGKTGTTYEWLKEFPPQIWRPDVTERQIIAWDWLPQDWTKIPEFYDPVKWKEVKQMKDGGVDAEYDRVCAEFDKLIASHGYERTSPDDKDGGQYYKAVKPNNDTIIFFCHLGLECVLLSRLIHCSPMTLWHNFCVAPTSVTTVVSEERREGIASFRISHMGDVSHLYAAGIDPAFSGRFRECYSNEDERRD